MTNTFIEARVFFSKTGRAKYISHLDLYRTMQRVIKRAKLPIWETQGFNKHIYLTFALPLSLGIEGEHESMDMRLTEDIPFDVLTERLNHALPDEIRVTDISAPVMKHTAIKKAVYSITTDCDKESFSSFLAQPKIEAEKRTKKKGISVIDLKPHILKHEILPHKIILTLPAGTDFNINPSLVLGEYKKFNLKDEECTFSICRTDVLTEDDQQFV